MPKKCNWGPFSFQNVSKKFGAQVQSFIKSKKLSGQQLYRYITKVDMVSKLLNNFRYNFVEKNKSCHEEVCLVIKNYFY